MDNDAKDALKQEKKTRKKNCDNDNGIKNKQESAGITQSV